MNHWISDIHITYDTATEDFQKALTYLNDNIDVAFTCISGDLTENGTEDELTQFKSLVEEYSKNTHVELIPGNHERFNLYREIYERVIGKPLYYSFEYGNDVYIMIGCYSWASDGVFTVESLQWLYETLERYKDKRCFIFTHVFPWGDSGNPKELYYFDIFSGTKGSVFLSLLKHYKNVILFHGHSHTKFYLQEVDKKANYSEALGYRSVHIPSLAVPRDIESNTLTNIYSDSEGYVMDVYKNHVVLRGRDFVKEKFLPIATYCLDTTLVEIEANTFVDSTGTITT